MELQRGLPLLLQQYKALFFKNALLSWRSKLSTFLRLFSSLLFIFLIFCIQKAMEERSSSSSSFKDDRDPSALVAPPIPACEERHEIQLPCFDFVWSGNGSARIGEIVRRIRENNHRPIPEEKVKAFRTPTETDDWLASNPTRCPGALHFVDRNVTVISYGLQTNSTSVAKRGKYEDPTIKFQIPLQLAAEREIARYLIGDPSFSWVVSLKEFAHPALAISVSALQTAGPTFFLAIAMFPFVFQISALLTEKELRLRQAMTMMGLYDTAYWLSWFSWEGIVVLLSSLFTVLFGMMFQFYFFLHNSFAVVFLLFFLFQLNMMGFAFVLSAFISKSSSSTVVGFSIFIIGFVTQLVTSSGLPYSGGFSRPVRIVWSFFPPNLLAAGLLLLSNATETPRDPGVSWKGRMNCAPNDTGCIITINEIYIWLVSTSCLWLVLAIYFDNIFPNTSGVRKSVLYCLNPGYWTGKDGNKWEEGSICSCTSSIPPFEDIVPDDEDVLEEESIVKQQAREGIVDSSIAAQIRGLVKVYAGMTKIGCCKCKRTSPYHALKGIWLNFPKNQLFCLLGPNGAGKTTVINCLTGITPVTGGDALIYGYSVRSSSGMSNIRKMIGVCPQFDVLWDALSGQEHLHLFASIKGVNPASVNSVVQKLLAEVKLSEAAKVRAGSYSGGMRRRLTVAMALIGEPRILILDEPTTGMDPITRRHVWDVIEGAKQGRAIILTTHSMEEADILGDKIGIMAKGRLRCIGTSLRLKSRFGTGFICNISFVQDINGTPNQGDAFSTAQNIGAVKEFFKSHLDIIPKEEAKSFLTVVIPHEKEKLLKNFFAELQERGTEFGIADIQFGLTTLEEVFLNIAKKAELESAAAEGTFATLALNSGLSVQVPIGARFVGLPGTESTENPRGVMVEVYWQQDDSGGLCIAGYSNEIRIPPHVQQGTAFKPSSSGRNSGRQKQVRGIIIDPSQINDSDLHELGRQPADESNDHALA